jgi:N-acetylglucosamine malate deacetylase 1
MNTVLVIAPHADDEILGCGATMAKHVLHGDEVIVIIATNAFIGAPEIFTENGIKAVREEALSAHSIIGVRETIFLDFPAPALNAFPEYKISIEFSKFFQKYKPTHLYLPHPGDIHQDHKAVYRSALVAARPQPDLKIASIYCYETLSETEWTPHHDKPFVPNHFVNVTEVYEKKNLAMLCFQSQLKEFPHSRSLQALEALAKFRGSTIGFERAESFIVERQIIL